MSERSFDYSFSEDKTSLTVKKRIQEDRLYLFDLVRVLEPYPAGLRRWSVMRRIRKNRDMARLPIPRNMEDAVERVFHNHCAASNYFKKLGRAPERHCSIGRRESPAVCGRFTLIGPNPG